MSSVSESVPPQGFQTEPDRSTTPGPVDQTHDMEFTQESQKQLTPPSTDVSLQVAATGVADNPVNLEESDFEATTDSVALQSPDFDAIDDEIDFDYQIESLSNPTASYDDITVQNEVSIQHNELLQEEPLDEPSTDKRNHEVIVDSQELSRSSSAAPADIIDISDDENKTPAQVTPLTGPPPARRLKRESSASANLALLDAFEDAAPTIDLDAIQGPSSPLFEPLAANDAIRAGSAQRNEPIDLDEEHDSSDRLPSLPLDDFIKLDTEVNGVEVGGPASDITLANMLRAFTENGASIEEATQKNADITVSDDVDSEEEDARLSADFAKLKAEHEARLASGEVGPGDDVRFRAAVLAEKNRKRLRKKRQDLEETELQETNSMFFPEPKRPSTSTSPASDSDSDEEEITVVGAARAASTTARKRGYEYLDDVSEDDNPTKPTQSRGKPAKRGRKRAEKSPSRTSAVPTTLTSSTRGRGGRGARRGGGRGGRGRGGKRGKPEDNLYSLATLLPYNIADQATLNRQQEAQPELGAQTRRANALADLIASLPDDQRDLHIGDKKALDNAVKNFTNSRTMKASEGGFKVKGMKFHLHHYQTIGTAKMRQRENEGKPFGGLLGDEMGLGKTVMAIANIIDGRPTTENRTRATLIVAPAALLKQWYNEVIKHADREVSFVKNVLIWKSSALQPSDPVAMLNSFDVVITSYHELLKSYPKKQIPLELITPRAKDEWWEKYFEQNKGVLHQVKWHRIILDEAQAIKNHLSRTSEAAWRLRGKFRWTLSGTPVVNSLEEFFAYFRFLKLWMTGDFETWKRNFCKKGSAKALGRLCQMLDKMMIRRTHKDKLFGRPIIQLPPIKTDTIPLEFSTVERALYKIVRDRFVQKIRSFGTSGGDSGLSTHYGSIFVLLLRLRQLTAHILLVQKTLKDLLLVEDLEKLWSLTRSPEARADPPSRAHADAVQEALQSINAGDSKRSETGSVTPVDTVDQSTKSKPGSDLSTQFRRCLESMRTSGEWEKVNLRSLCSECGHPPVKPHVTSCLHLYCFACLNELAFAGLLEEQEAATCRECNVKFKICEAYAAQPFTQTEALRSQRGSTSRRSRDHDVEEDIDWFTMGGPILQSTKTNAAVAQIEKWFEQDPTNKILVFSQWRGMLKVFSRVCSERKWGHEQFHGEMSFDARNKAVERFSNKPTCRILLAAMKAGGVGLNLTAANRVLLIDLWWNVAMEDQAYCRVFRIGQTRDVEVVRFAVKNTVDFEMLKMQKRKTTLINSAMERGGGKPKLTTEELLQLFGMGGAGDDGENGDEAFILPDDPYVVQDSDVDEDDDVSAELQ